MRATLSRLAASPEFRERRSIAVLLLILLAVGATSGLHAVAKPFWFDELSTVILCRLDSASEIWKALENAADANPPLFYVIGRWTRQFILDDHLAYRLPSILGLLGTLLCLYVILSRKVDHLSALVGATFVLCTPLAAYAYEARPYALMLGCVSGGILAWQRIDDSRLYSLLLGVTLGAAVSLHYYAILVWPAFLLAEAWVWLGDRRFRPGAWAALLLGAVPLLALADLALTARQYYGLNFWAQPSFRQIFAAHNWLFNVGSNFGFTFAVGLTVIVAYGCLKGVGGRSSGHRNVERGLSIGECVLTLTLLWLPVVAVAAAAVGHGGMTLRYMMPAVLGGALAVGFVTSKLRRPVRVLLLTLTLMNFGLSSGGAARNLLTGSLLEERAAVTRHLKAILTQEHESGLPMVISSGFQYLEMAYYTPADLSRQVYITDPRASLTYTRADSLDLALLKLRQYAPLNVEDYGRFVSMHREFLVVSKKGANHEWLPARLVHDGHTLRLLSNVGQTQIYRVTLQGG